MQTRKTRRSVTFKEEESLAKIKSEPLEIKKETLVPDAEPALKKKGVHKKVSIVKSEPKSEIKDEIKIEEDQTRQTQTSSTSTLTVIKECKSFSCFGHFWRVY